MCQVLFYDILTNVEHYNRIEILNMNNHRIHRVAKLTGSREMLFACGNDDLRS